MFERFSKEARRAIVLAQEEARRLNHNYIGTEHLLLGVLAEPGEIAANALDRFGLNLTTGRDDVVEIIGMGQQPIGSGHIPFTPRAKKSLELALREAINLGHDYIGPEHVLLGMIREGDGVAAQILIKHAGSLKVVRAAVIDLVPPAYAGQARRWLRRRPEVSKATKIALRPDIGRELRTTPAADISLAEAAVLAGQSAVGSHHILLAALSDADSAAARAIVGLGVDLNRVREALRDADVTGSSDELPEDAGRRQMTVTVTDNRITVEASDPTIVKLGRAAIDALAARTADPAGQPSAGSDSGTAGVIRGDSPLSASLSLVWQALHDSLEEIRGRATATADPPAAPAPPANPAVPPTAEPPAQAAGTD